MRRKRLLCVLLAALLLLAQAGYAEDLELPEESQETPVEEAVPLPEPAPVPEPVPEELPAWEPETLPVSEPQVINVVVPDSGHIVLNPYRLDVSADSGVSRDQVVHVPQSLSNLSSVPVRVDVRVTGEFGPWSGASLTTAPPALDTPRKELFLYVEFQTVPVWNGWFGGLPNQVAVTPWGESKSGVLTLEPWSEGWFHLDGTASASPDQPWLEDDTVDVTLAFTFSPVEEVPLPAEEPDIFAPPVQEPEPPADIPADPAEELPADVPSEPAEELPAEPSEEPPEDVPADSLAPLPDDHAGGTLDGSSDPAPAPSEDLLDPDLAS